MQSPRAFRTTELIKEFSRLGHEVVVYAILGKYDYTNFEKKYNVSVKRIPTKYQRTAYSSDGITKRSFFDKVLGKVLGKILHFPDIELLFSIPKIITKENNFDLLISIANPHPVHWGCAKAKQKLPNKFPRKWVADCGDPFMKNGLNKNKRFEKYERLFSNNSDFISVPIESAKKAYYKEYRHKIKVIPQGFDFEVPIKENKINNKVLTFAFTGVFLKDIRNPKIFFQYLENRTDNFKFIIYTPFTDLVDPFLKTLSKKIEIRSYIAREDLLKILSKMDFLLNLENINSPNQLPSKLIDYAIVNRPILSINPNNLNVKKLDAFFKRDYSERLVVENIEKYHISTIAKQFLNL